MNDNQELADKKELAEEVVGIIGNQQQLEASRKLDLEALYQEAGDDAPEYTQQDLANVIFRLQRRWNCSPSTVRHRILGNADRKPRPRKPKPKGRDALVARQKKKRN